LTFYAELSAMPILIFQHTATEHAARLALTLRDHARKLDVRRLDLPETRTNPHIPTDFDNVEGIISLGGQMNVGDDLPWMQRETEFLAAAHKRNVPTVGICLGAQLIAKALGGTVAPMAGEPEWGMLPVRQFPIANTDIILAGIPWELPQFHAHGQEITTLPPGAAALQASDKCKVQSFRAGLRTYGFQYHFECDLAMIREFLTSGDPQMAASGLSAEHGMEEARIQYEMYTRTNDRLAVNLVTYLFASARAMSA